VRGDAPTKHRAAGRYHGKSAIAAWTDAAGRARLLKQKPRSHVGAAWNGTGVLRAARRGVSRAIHNHRRRIDVPAHSGIGSTRKEAARPLRGDGLPEVGPTLGRGEHGESTGRYKRVDLSSGRAVGPGKIQLLEQIHKSGSIIQAGRDPRLSYRRAWLLINDLNNSFRFPVIEAAAGRSGGGGTQLTPFGRKLVQLYKAIKAEASAATREHRRELQAALKTDMPGLLHPINRRLAPSRARP
jgi:molybdate transport system regulatory protein